MRCARREYSSGARASASSYRKNDVQVRGVTQFLSAELAVGDDGEARRVAVAVAQLRPAQFQRDREHQIGKRRQMVGQHFHGELTRQVLRQQAENLSMV
jgi:hypothetical protein